MPPKEPKSARSNGPRQRRPGQSMVPILPPRHHELIGAVVVQWSRLEAVIQEAIWALLKLDITDGRVITSSNDISLNISILRTLLTHKISQTLSKRLINGLNRIQPIMEARNLIVHGVWGTVVPEQMPGVLAVRKKTSDLGFVVWEGFSAEYLVGMIKAIDEIKDAWGKLIPQLPALLETQALRPSEG